MKFFGKNSILHRDSTDLRRGEFRAGVTLLEFVVAFGIFLLLVTIAGGSFIRSVRVQRTALQLMSVNDNMGIVLEQMMREMRTGYHFCTRGNPMDYPGIPADVIAQCASLASGADTTEIQFVNANNETVRYRWKNEAIQKGVLRTEFLNPMGDPGLCAEGELDTTSGVCYRSITADNIKVTGAYFDPLYNEVDGYAPRIVLSFSVTTKDKIAEGLVDPITIQSTVSARCGESSCPSDS